MDSDSKAREYAQHCADLTREIFMACPTAIESAYKNHGPPAISCVDYTFEKSPKVRNLILKHYEKYGKSSQKN